MVSSADKDNWEPRFGFAWSPSFESGFHASFVWQRRRFLDPRRLWHLSWPNLSVGVLAGRRNSTIQSTECVLLQPIGVATSIFNPINLADPTNGFVFMPGPQTARHTLTLIDPDLEMPYTQQWNLTIERQMPFASAVRVSYTGNRGIGLLKYSLDNLPLHDPVNGVRVVDHPNNPANPARSDHRPAANIHCAGTAGTTAIPFTALCPVVVPIAAH